MGGMYPQTMSGPVAEPGKGRVPTAFYLILLVIIAIALIMVPDHMNGPSGDPINGLLHQVVASAATPKSTPLSFSQAKKDLQQNYPKPSPNADYSGDLAGFDDTRRPAATNYSYQEVEQRPVRSSTPAPAPAYGYRVTCGSKFEFVDDALKDYQKTYPQAQIFSLGSECKHKIVLYAATTRKEVERWVSRTRRLPKGYIVSLSE